MRRVFFLFIAITAAWAGYRYFVLAPEWVDEFIAKPLIDLLPILFVVLTIEKNSLESLGLTRHNYLSYALMGVGLGGLLLFESLMTRYFKYGAIQLLSFTPMSLVLNACIAFATALVEETVFRGYFFRRLLWLWNNEFFANIISTSFFVIAHLPLAIFSLHYTGGDLAAYCAQIFVLGAIFAYVFGRVETLVPTTIAHTLWNFSNVFIR